MERYQQSEGESGSSLHASGDRRDETARAFVPRPPPSHVRNAHDREPAGAFARVVEDAFAPRPVAALRSMSCNGLQVSERTLTNADVAAFTELVLTATMPDVMRFVERASADGVPVDALYVDLLEAAARRLGELWLADRCSFAEVTMAMARLQVVLREVGSAFPVAVECVKRGRRLLLTPAAGEQHTFGLLIVAELFMRAGWDVWGGAAPGDDVVRLVREGWFDVVGLSVGCLPRLEALTAEIRRIRTASRNRAIGVMVGGTVFITHPEYVARVGADATAADGRQAPQVAESLLAARASPC